MAGERRKYLRVLFEETIHIDAGEWQDPMGTGLDISLNGTRFHCEHSTSEDDIVTVKFSPELSLKGVVRWCWPIEWYYQAAIEFEEFQGDDAQKLRDYIAETTGEPYPDYFEVEDEEESETVGETEEDTLAMEEDADLFDSGALGEEDDENLFEHAGDDEEDEDDDLSIDKDDLNLNEDLSMDEDDLSMDDELSVAENSAKGSLSVNSNAGKTAIVFDSNSARSHMIAQYLSKRIELNVREVSDTDSLFGALSSNTNVVILEYVNAEESLELLNEVNKRADDVNSIFVSGPVSLEERLDALNNGVNDFISRPVHISAIAQSVLLRMNASATFHTAPIESDIDDDFEVSLAEDSDLENF